MFDLIPCIPWKADTMRRPIRMTTPVFEPPRCSSLQFGTLAAVRPPLSDTRLVPRSEWIAAIVLHFAGKFLVWCKPYRTIMVGGLFETYIITPLIGATCCSFCSVWQAAPVGVRADFAILCICFSVANLSPEARIETHPSPRKRGEDRQAGRRDCENFHSRRWQERSRW